MSDNNTVNTRTKNALCYIPLAAIFIHFTETEKTDDLKKHIKYWITIFIAYSILSVFLSWIFWGLLFVLYIGLSWFLWFKAYNWEDVEISFIDNLLSDKSKK